MAVVELLHRVPLLAVLPDDTTAALAQRAVRRSFRRDEIVFHKGDPGDAMFLIEEGQVQIILPSPSGDAVLLGMLGAGDCFGELSVIDGEQRSATIVASEPTRTIMIRQEDFSAALHANPRVAVDLLRVLAHRLRRTNAFVEDAIFLDVRARLAKKLLELAEVYGSAGPDGTVIELRLTQRELAAMVGATRESVHKHLQAYRARGVIAMQRQRVVIHRPDELRRRVY